MYFRMYSKSLAFATNNTAERYFSIILTFEQELSEQDGEKISQDCLGMVFRAYWDLNSRAYSGSSNGYPWF